MNRLLIFSLQSYIAFLAVVYLVEYRSYDIVQQLVVKVEPIDEHAQGNNARDAYEELLFHCCHHPL